MTNAQENKPRDIWMRIPNSGISHDFITNISGSSQWPGREIQFIEMSAYLALQAENENLKQANKKLREGLKFYANPAMWEEIWIDNGVEEDGGDCSCKVDMEDVEIKRDSDGTIYYSVAGLTARNTLSEADKIEGGS